MSHMTITLTSTAPSDLRMLTTLLTTTDPAGRVATVESPSPYDDTASLVLQSLRAGEELATVMLTLPAETPADSAWRFARAAQTWWDHRLAVDEQVLQAAC